MASPQGSHGFLAGALWAAIACGAGGPVPSAFGEGGDIALVARALRPPGAPGEKAVLDALEDRAREALGAIDHPTTRGAWEAAVPRLRRELRASLGIDRLPEPRPEGVQVVGTLERGSYRIEKLVYRTLPGMEVPAHLYVPAGLREKAPAVLFVPGHWYADSKARGDFQALAINLARRGFVVLTYDPFGQGERGISLRDHRRTELLPVGVAQQAIVDFESICALEVLLARGEVDPRRIGMTGASGGGYASWIVPALDPRVAVTVPVVGTSEFYEQLAAVRERDWYDAKEHCHFVPRLLRYANNHELLAMAAPRPVMVIAALDDHGFRIGGNRRVVEYGRALYAALGHPERLGYFEDDAEGHGYGRRKREAACGWFLKWLKGEGDGSPAPETPAEPPPWDHPELRCFPEKRSSGPGFSALARSLKDGLPPPRERDRLPDLAASLREALGLPVAAPSAPAPQLERGEPRAASGVRIERVRWRMQDGVEVPAVLLGPPGEWKGALLGACDEGKEVLLLHAAVRTALARRLAVVLADPRGMGENAQAKPGWVFAVSLLLGESFPGRQAVDLAAGLGALERLPELRGKPIGLFGSGPFAALAALYAAVLEPRAAWLVSEGGFRSFRDFIDRPRTLPASYKLLAAGEEAAHRVDREVPAALVLFDALRRFDLPDLHAALAPRPSLVLTAIDGDFEPVPGKGGNGAGLEEVLAPQETVLFEDDFSRYPTGLLSQPVGQLNPAIQEYHYLAHRGVPLSPWAMPIIYLDAWAAGEEDGSPYLEMHLGPENQRMSPRLFSPLFVTGDPEWSDCAVEASVKPLARDDLAGLVFRYHTNRHHYAFVLTGGNRARLAVRQPLEKTFRECDWRELGSIEFPYEVRRYYRLRVENQGPKMRCSIDGRLVLQAEDGEILKGKAGLTASVPARFRDFRVTAANGGAIALRIREREAELASLQAAGPKPVLWGKFETRGFGCGRNVRFGDLDGDGRIDLLFAQIVSKVDGGNFVEASCLTAVTLEGKVLWQSGKPNPRNGLLTSDTPFQVHDQDGDGRAEVFLVKDFKLQVLDGATGKLKRWIWMPEVPDDYRKRQFELKERPHDLNTGDSIAFFDLSGKGRRAEVLLKDRYRYFWVLDAGLKPLWGGSGQLGHFPYAFDADGDGRDEVFIGYARWTPAGSLLWSKDAELKDHADGLACGNFTGDPKAEPRLYAVGSDEGFLVFDLQGNILKHQRVGHAQNLTVAKLRPDLPGLQIAAINFWKNPGILTVFDTDGNILLQGEPHHHGSMILPVNWRGDGQEFLLLSGNVREGGLLDGRLRRAVVFPDDGHPDLAAAALDVAGDPRDEVLLWDQERVWIYTQDRPFGGERIYAPARNPRHNDSNYRSSISLPGWRAWPDR